MFIFNHIFKYEECEFIIMFSPKKKTDIKSNLPEFRIQKIKNITEQSLHKPIDEWVSNISERFKKNTKVEMGEVDLSVLRSALEYRIEKFKDWENYYGSIFEDVTGTYAVVDEYGGQFLIEISNEPIHILTRTTGRPGYSCEQINQHYWLGPFHDLALANATAYFWDAFSNEWLGRVNMRWCITDTGKIDIGVDPNIYPAEVTHNNRRDDEMLLWALYTILLDAGYFNYKTAETPYIYKGHSDTTLSGGVKLPYSGIQNF